MSVVKIFAFLELKQKIAFFKGFNAFCSARSSDFPALPAAFPFRKGGTVALKAKRVPASRRLRSGQGYSGRSAPEFHGIPY